MINELLDYLFVVYDSYVNILVSMHNNRTKVVKEILSTEVHYVSSLGKLINVVVAPLKSNNLITKQEIADVFSEIEYPLLINHLNYYII